MASTSEELVPAVFATRPRVRRRASMIPCQRKDRLDAVRLIDFEGVSSKDLAKVYGVKRRTIQRWAEEARAFPEYETIRRRHERAS